MVELRFIKNEEHQYIEYIICSCGKKLVAKNLRELNEDLIIGYSCKLAYKLIKIDGEYMSRDLKFTDS
jgi:hypothetical protein